MLEFPEHSGHLLGLCLELLGPFINYVIQIGGGGGFSQKLTHKKNTVGQSGSGKRRQMKMSRERVEKKSHLY